MRGRLSCSIPPVCPVNVPEGTPPQPAQRNGPPVCASHTATAGQYLKLNQLSSQLPSQAASALLGLGQGIWVGAKGAPGKAPSPPTGCTEPPRISLSRPRTRQAVQQISALLLLLLQINSLKRFVCVFPGSKVNLKRHCQG